MTTDHHIQIIRQEGIDEDPLATFCEELSDDLKVEIKEMPRAEVFAALEWVIPTLVITYLAKPYFEGFLTEAGKDHYLSLRNALVKLAQAYVTKSPVIQWIFSSKGKVKETTPRYSLSFSILAYIQPGLTLKLVFRSDATELDVEESVSVFLRTIRRIHNGQYRDGEIQGLNDTAANGDTITVVYKGISKSLIVLDGRRLDEDSQS